MRADCAGQSQVHRRDDRGVCESAAGRILKMLVEKGAVSPVPALRCKVPYAVAGLTPDASPGDANPQLPARSSTPSP